jgi:hypothetical protein
MTRRSRRSARRLRVLCWNMGGAFGPYIERHDDAWRWVAEVDPDIALIQECVPPAWATNHWCIVHEPFRYWASAVIAKPTVDIRRVAAMPDLLRRFGSYLATAEFDIADVGTILVASVHTRAAEAPGWATEGHDRSALARSSVGVPWSNDVAFAGYLELLAARPASPFLIGGDWNTARYIDDQGMPAADGTEFMDRAAAAGWVDMTLDTGGREVRTWFGRPGPRPYQPDHVLGSSDVRATNFRVDEEPVVVHDLSDHAPLVLEVEVRSRSKGDEERDAAA